MRTVRVWPHALLFVRVAYFLVRKRVPEIIDHVRSISLSPCCACVVTKKRAK